MNFFKVSILLVVTLVSGCANNMVLYKNDVAGIDFSSNNLPRTRSCIALKRAYDDGFSVRIKSGIRWINSGDVDRYKCSGHDSTYCQNTSAIVTKLTKRDEGVIAQCARDIRLVATKKSIKPKSKLDRWNEIRIANQEKIRKEVERDVLKNTLFEKLLKVEYKGIRPVNLDLSANMYRLVESVISSVDVNDFKGEVVLGVSKNLPITLGQLEPYSVLKVDEDRVYLSCGKVCGLPVIGIVRVNQRPSPIEGIEYNDSRGVYMFVGVEHFYSKKGRLVGDTNKVQALIFHRITLNELGLPKDYFEESKNELSLFH